MAMEIRQEDALEGMGDDKRALLRQCVEGAWTLYTERFRPVLPYCTPRGMANILHELTVQQIRDKFAEVPGVEIRENWVKNRFLLEISGVMILQFKKLTKNFQTRNIRTRTSLAFDGQRDVEGMPSLPRVTVGYQLGQYNTEIAGIWLAFLIGKEAVVIRRVFFMEPPRMESQSPDRRSLHRTGVPCPRDQRRGCGDCGRGGRKGTATEIGRGRGEGE